ncbi:MAG: hypothetical protein HC797_03720 [Anaerolineales bacterium]|nr:hypothetical protein [Anaerolineales bacterium]
MGNDWWSARFVTLLQTTKPDLVNPLLPLQIASFSLLGLMLAGVFIGGMLGFFIGSSIKNDDEYLYNESIHHKLVLVQVLADDSRVSRARDLLHQVQLDSHT